tara:strand:+ start:147 stop:248 length:102 start_codon:yes stop_codon:yes gene_type:complete
VLAVDVEAKDALPGDEDLGKGQRRGMRLGGQLR